MARWALEVQLAGDMPSLPSQNSSLRGALTSNEAYLQRLMDVSEKLGSWIVTAQEAGHLNRQLPPEIVLYTLFARACDPVLGLLKLSGQHSDASATAFGQTPPTPSPTMNRSASICSCVRTNAPFPANTE